MLTQAAIAHFKRAYVWMEHSDYSSELERVKNLRPEAVTREYFLSTYSRVVLAAGFKAEILDTLWPALEKAFRGWDIEAIAGSTDEVTRAALEVFNRRDKMLAIMSMAKRLATADWPTFKASLTGPGGLEIMEKLPWIGPTTKYHLARNIGLEYAKPDRAMKKLAEEFGYGDGVFKMVKDIVEATGERRGVIDIVLWRFEVSGRWREGQDNNKRG